MKISLNWLLDFVKIDPKVSIENLAWRLTEATAEVEKVHHLGEGLESIIVGEVIHVRPHKDADRLHVAKVKINSKNTIQVIFGQKAPISIGDKVPVAAAPTQLHGGKVEKTKLRGELSEGMLCLDSEMIPGAPESLYYFKKSVKVGTPITDILPLKDIVLEIDNHSITHRPDLFSHYGFCRELVALGLAKWRKRYPTYKPSRMVGKKKLPFKVKCTDKKIFSHYNGTIVESLDTRQSPPWMRYRLQSIGVRSLNAIVDITNYVMFETGAPMHAFDREKITGHEFIFRLSKDGESMITLDKKIQKLFKDIMVVECDKKIVDLLGIMGGENSAISDDTNTVYFHQGIYNPVLLRKAMIGLGHRTDAGTIFEKGLDAELSVLGQCRTLELTKQIFPKAKFNHEMVVFKHFNYSNKNIEITAEKIKKHLGAEIDLKLAKNILGKLGCKVTLKSKSLVAGVPSWRRNSLNVSADLVEEIARIYGYSNIPTLLPLIQVTQPGIKRKSKLTRLIRNNLIGQGFMEELNWSFTGKETLEKLEPIEKDTTLKIINPVTEDLQFMRTSQLPLMLQNLGRNQRIEKKDYRVFEIGKIFARMGEEQKETEMLSMLLSGNNAYLKLKGVLESLAEDIQVSFLYEVKDLSISYPGKSVEINVAEKMIGHLFILHPSIQDRFDIQGEVALVNIELDELYSLHEDDKSYQHIIRYPAVKFDISIIVPENQEFRSIKSVVSKVESQLLRDIELKEVYRGKNIGDAKKSVTLALTYQSSERTIEAEEADNIISSLIKQIEKDGGKVRK
jgi:phenylalanyl-tRNA synthetase beta chain